MDKLKGDVKSKSEAPEANDDDQRKSMQLCDRSHYTFPESGGTPSALLNTLSVREWRFDREGCTVNHKQTEGELVRNRSCIQRTSTLHWQKSDTQK